MAEPFIWGSLAKANNDPTLIEQAIDNAIEGHNDDPDAHIGDGKALESHRAAEIIDHVAQSVVNDKIAAAARSYVAIVGGDVISDYDTIAEAVDFAMGTDGGTILILPGTHEITTAIPISPKINFQGLDVESCIISITGTSGTFQYIDDDTTNQVEAIFENLTINSVASTNLFTKNSSYDTMSKTLKFRDCRFVLNGLFSSNMNHTFLLYDCSITAYGTNFQTGGYTVRFYDSDITWSNASTSSAFSGYVSSSTQFASMSWFRCTVNLSTNGTAGIRNGTGGIVRDVRDTTFYGMHIGTATQSPRYVYNSYITIKTGTRLTIGAGSSGCVYSTSVFSGGLEPNVRAGSYGGYIFACSYSGDPRIYPYPLELTESTSVPEAYTMPSAETQFKAWLGKELSHTPTANKTVTIAGGVAGQVRVIRFLSTTTSRTITFGAGFKNSATLATGTTASRQFIVVFVSAQSYWYETYRSGALTL